MTAEIAAADGRAVRLRGARRRATRAGSGREASCFYVTRVRYSRSGERPGCSRALLGPSGSDTRTHTSHYVMPSRRQAALPRTGCAQKAQRRASMGISLRHSGHFFVVGSAGAGSFFIREINQLTGTTTKKYTAAAIRTKEMTALTKSPIGKVVPRMANLRLE